MRLHFVPRSGTHLDAEFDGHLFTLFLDGADLPVGAAFTRWMLGVDGEIVSSFGSLNQAKHAAEQFAIGLVLGPGVSSFASATSRI